MWPVLLFKQLIHRTLAVMVGSTLVLGILSILDKVHELLTLHEIIHLPILQRPSLEMAIGWVDPETVSLLVGMVDWHALILL